MGIEYEEYLTYINYIVLLLIGRVHPKFLNPKSFETKEVSVKWNEYRKMISKYPWIKTVVTTLARRYDMLGENEPLSRDFVRHQIEHLALHGTSTIDWDKKGGSEVNGIWTIQTWVPFTSIQDKERCSLPIGDVYASSTARQAVDHQRLLRGDFRVTVDCMAWVTHTFGARQSKLQLDLYQTAIYLGPK